MSFLQGNTYLLAVKFYDEKGTEEIDGSRVVKAEFVFNTLQFLYTAGQTGRVSYDSESNCFVLGLRESETLGLKGVVKWQAKALLDDGSVSGTLQASDYLYDTLCKTVLGGGQNVGEENGRILSANLINVVSSGTTDYEDLENKPQINNVELIGNKTAHELGLANESDIPTATSDLTNDGDGLSPFATQSYVEANGGKIDSISVNGVAQTIDANKNVDITVPTDVSDLNNDLNFQTGNDVENAISTATSGMLTTSNYATTLDSVYQAKGSYATTSDLSAVSGRVSTIESKIPEQASSSNQLADKDFVNSSISTATATFRGTYNLVSDLSLTTSATEGQIATALLTAVSTADNNDYCFVQIPTADATPAEISRIDRYKFNGTAWAYEYSLNNSGFTASQWAAINSGATTTNIGQISTNTSNISSLNSNKVDKTTAIAGVDLQDNITKAELLTALNVEDGAEVNVQPNWSQTDTTADDYIQNKPTIPTVNDATVTITTDGNTLGSFTVNQSNNSTIDLGIRYGLLRWDE